MEGQGLTPVDHAFAMHDPNHRDRRVEKCRGSAQTPSTSVHHNFGGEGYRESTTVAVSEFFACYGKFSDI